ncbi:MAG: hypothetical protein M0C28_22845 [Candidatus Moduliflexus flocculans]|nr:hypothetical protein [Candidatus Moduliflexus flocculans]
MYSSDEDRRGRLLHQADELPLPHHDLQERASTPTATCPCAGPSSGTVYRYERSGALHGLMRVRGFTQDDAHIICTPEQIEDEIARGPALLACTCCKTLGLQGHQGLPGHQARRTGRSADAATLGPGHWNPCARPSTRRAWPTRWTRAAAPSTAPRSTSRSRTPSAASGS